MAKKTHDLRPIQVLLDTKRFIELEVSKPWGGGTKDFFRGNDKGFLEHKEQIKARIQDAAASLRQRNQPGDFLRVRQREGALAKTHRPVSHLFSESNQFMLVGAERVGELLFQVTPDGMDRLANIIESKVELTPRIVINKKTGEPEPRVSVYRSELGGIEDIQLYGATDKVRFSAAEAVRWMQQPNVIGGYIVELFRPARRISLDLVRHLVANFREGLERIPGGLLVRPILPSEATAQFGEPSLVLSVHLITGGRRLIELPFFEDGRAAEMAEASLPGSMREVTRDLSIDRHTETLAMLAEQSLVRSVELPPILETTPIGDGANLGPSTVGEPSTGVDYPIVAIIDGGVAGKSPLNKWKVGDAGLVPSVDRDEAHGTFIAGLICAANTLNPALSGDIEPQGCKFFDLDLFPRRDLRGSYYTDIEDLFDALDEKVKVAKRNFGVRIFNFSFSIGQRSSRLAYSIAADRLDRIARINDVIFVVAAGNLVSSASRPPWPVKANDAAAMLAGFSTNDEITAPSDHVLGFTIGAVNPHGVLGHVPLMPTTYTRRGPGVGGARKPELAHYGGVDGAMGNMTGLVSLNPSGDAVHGCGTSFASPLAAATIATLDHRLARKATRETLLALPVHRATRPDVFKKRALRHVARDFVGFGITPPADTILNDAPHSVTLVFSDRLKAKQRLDFDFAWPRSLVNSDGSCRGRADVTLSFTPPIDPDHREEAIRVQLEAFLYQEKLDELTGDRDWESQLDHDAADVPKGMARSESYLIRTGLKWSPIKRYSAVMKNGRGNTSNWRLSLSSLARDGIAFPAEGIVFTLLMTISDLDETAPVREEMRFDLQNRGIVLADITMAHRVRQRPI